MPAYCLYDPDISPGSANQCILGDMYHVLRWLCWYLIKNPIHQGIACMQLGRQYQDHDHKISLCSLGNPVQYGFSRISLCYEEVPACNHQTTRGSVYDANETHGYNHQESSHCVLQLADLAA